MIKNVYEKKKFFFDSKQPVIKLEHILEVAKELFNDNTTLDDFEKHIIGVLYRGLVGGYIHHNNKVIVFSVKNPFPELSINFDKNYDKIL